MSDENVLAALQACCSDLERLRAAHHIVVDSEMQLRAENERLRDGLRMVTQAVPLPFELRAQLMALLSEGEDREGGG